MPLILHIEDNVGDVILTQEAFKTLSIDSINFEVAYNGQEGLKYLQSPENDLPDLILLDVNMPIMNGKEFLAIVKQDDRLKRIPIVILTTSKNTVDIKDCYDLNVNAYIYKTIDFDQFSKTIQALADFWLKENIVS